MEPGLSSATPTSELQSLLTLARAVMDLHRVAPGRSGNLVNLGELCRALERLLKPQRRAADPQPANELTQAWIEIDSLRKAQRVARKRLQRESDLSCAICGGPLPDRSGPGARPDHHLLCRTLSNDMSRVEEGLKAIWSSTAEPGINRLEVRRWVFGVLLPLLNVLTIQERRKPVRRSIRERILTMVKQVARTREGRSVLGELGISLPGQ